MVAEMTTRTDLMGLANNYGVVFGQVERGRLSYKLRFPSWQEFYTRHTTVPSDNSLQRPPWLTGILLPMITRLNLAAAQVGEVEGASGGAARLPPVYFRTRRFPAPKSYDTSRRIGKITDVCVIYGFIVLAPVLVKRIAEEKSVGMKELLRIAGVPDSVYWLSAFLGGLVVMAAVALIITSLLMLPVFCSPAIMSESDFTLVFATVMVYAAHCDLFCLLISCVVKTPVYAVFATVSVWMLTYEVPIFFMDVPGYLPYENLSLGQKILTSIFPNMALHWMFRIINLHEENNQGAHWSNLHLTGTPYDNVTLVGLMSVVLCYCLLYALLVWYLDNVWPWQYGIPKEPLFFTKRSYWNPKAAKNLEEKVQNAGEETIPIEGVREGVTAGIVIDNVTKVYPNETVALVNVSLKAFPGDVTVLLGRNGAGKTTLLRLITGLEEASRGSVYVAGRNVALDTDAARQSMGFCPQENILFLGLTVLEHLQFFARIRTGSWATAHEAIEEILVAFNLSEKRNTVASSLSWGTRRKLQLGIAIVGSPKIVVLDEPTSGADPECKGALWECVLRFHEDKTMLLTTHSMEEADTLGDRIAVLAAGRLRCCGSPLFLRQHYATGYCIRASMKKSVPTKGVARIILTHVPKSQLQVDDFDTLSANLGDIDVHTLIKLLHKLEEDRGELEWLSVYAAALEDVLRKAECGLPESAEQQPNPPAQLSPAHSAPDGTPPSQEHAVEQHLSLVQANRTSAAGMRPNVKQQVGALVLKKLQYARRDFKLPVLMLLLPLSVLLLFVFINQTLISRIMIYSGPLEYSLLKIFGHTVAFFTADENMKVDQEYKRYLTEEEGADVRDLGSDDPSEWMQDVAQSNYRRYRARYVIGAEFRSITNVSQLPAGAVVPADHTIEDGDEVTEVTAWHSAYSPHSMAVSVVAASRAFLPGWRLRVVNHPLPRENPKPEPNPVIVIMTRLMCAVFIPVGLAFLAATYVLFPVQERVRNVKLLQLLSGTSPAVFWGTSFVVDLALQAFCSLVLLLPFVLLDRHGLYSDFPTLGSIFTLTLSYGFSSIPLAYVVSLLCDQPSTGYVTIASISIVAGMILNVSMTLLYLLPVLTDPPSNETRDTSGLDAALWVFRGIPCFSLAWGVSNCLQISEETIMCRYMSTFDRLVFCKNLILTKIPDHLNHFIECCPETCRDCILSKRYLSWDKMSAGRDVCVMMLVGFALLCLVVLVDSGKASVAYWRTRCAKSPAGGTGTNEERARLARLLSDGRTEQAALVVDNLSKHYGRLQAVRGISFTVRKHECFGLLGMNGAGKTTTFRMLAGDLAPTAGNAYIDDVDLVGNKGKASAWN
ncbi:phospholipid-transporting ATPase ABCA3-like [Haemaphysalis longicornis]